jgi:ribulose-bisphosphate carboxylase large chain
VIDDRIVITYHVADDDPLTVAEAIRVEQTIEFPFDLAPTWIQEEVVGRIEWIDGPRVSISYDPRVVADDLVQLLNVLWGNVSLFPGVRVTDLTLPPSVLAAFRGPRFGVTGLREMFDAVGRPLVCTALKPMGLPVADLARSAITLAEAGFDIIKDDHGLANQEWARWRERVRFVGDAVREASERSGTRSRYLPALNVPADRLFDAAHEAKAAGAGGLLILPGLTGFDAMRAIADDDSIGLPIMSHPSFLGSHVVSPRQGIDHGILLGTIARLAGADISIFPNHGGRFSFSPEQCLEIRDRCMAPLGGLAATWASPGGGMSLDRIPDMLEFYGNDVALLIGGALHRGDLAANARAMLSAASSTR